MRTLLATALLLVTTCSLAEWTPPENPDPSAILNQAQDDRRAGRYEEAMEKHIWYHENALKHDKGQVGVRLSFALMYWKELGEKYPPALEKLRGYQMEAMNDLIPLNKAGTPISRQLSFKERRAFFHDFVGINRTLGEEEKTVSMFKILDEAYPELAKATYVMADEALVEAREFELCDKYIDEDAAVDMYVEHLKRFQNDPDVLDAQFGQVPPEQRAKMQEIMKGVTRKSACRIVAIIAGAGRKEKAEELAARLREAWDDAELRSMLDGALEGKVPSMR